MKILMYIIPFKNSIEISLNKIAEKKKKGRASESSRYSLSTMEERVVIHVMDNKDRIETRYWVKRVIKLIVNIGLRGWRCSGTSDIA